VGILTHVYVILGRIILYLLFSFSVGRVCASVPQEDLKTTSGWIYFLNIHVICFCCKIIWFFYYPNVSKWHAWNSPHTRS